MIEKIGEIYDIASLSSDISTQWDILKETVRDWYTARDVSEVSCLPKPRISRSFPCKDTLPDRP